MMPQTNLANHTSIIGKVSIKDLKTIYKIAIDAEYDYDVELRLTELETRDVIEFVFGGTGGTQFPTIDSLKSFFDTMGEVFEKHQISIIHLYPVLYIARLYDEVHDKQHIDKFSKNNLVESATMLKSFLMSCTHAYDGIVRTKSYNKLEKDDVPLVIFHKKDHTPLKADFLETYNPQKDSENKDLIIFIKVKILNIQLYIPNDFTVTSNSLLLSNLKIIDQPQILFQWPSEIKVQLLKSWIDVILKEHKSANSIFYNSLLTITDLRNLENIKISPRKNHYSLNKDLVFIGGMIQEYLIVKNQRLTKPKAAKFILEFLALMKLLPLKTKESLILNNIYGEKDYSKVLDLYKVYGQSHSWVRELLKNFNLGKSRL